MKITLLTILLSLGNLITWANITDRQAFTDTIKPQNNQATKIHVTTDTLHAEPGDVIFEKVEEEATFPGGQSEFMKFLVRNLNPTVPVDNGAPAGAYTVIVQFWIEVDGSITNITPLTNHGYGVEKEVIRLIKKFPPWQPAMQNGKAVKSARKQPITFEVAEEYTPKKKSKKRE